MIRDTITKEIGEAMKARDEIKLSTLRMLSSALNYEKIAKQHDLTPDEEMAVVKKEVKKRQDAIESIRMAQGKHSTSDPSQLESRLKQEETELELLKAYLPEELPQEELEKAVLEAISETGAKSIQDMGKVMSAVMGKVGARADGKTVSELVKQKLQ